MPSRYLPDQFEAKWRQRWKEADLFVTQEDPDKPKFYALDFFPYPSGHGLSVGHCRNYVPGDVLSRMKRMQGHNVLHPMGFDAFGLPAENAAIKEKRNPAEIIEEFADNYRRQLDLVGIGYDWSRSFKSSEPSYYKWTQWIFKLLYDRGLAYRKDAAVNWDPVEKTVLADEEVIAGRAERSGALVERKSIPQWFFRITAYADRLIDDLDDLDWPEGIKLMQRNWIGRSEGVEFEMKVATASAEEAKDDGNLVVKGSDKAPSFRVFTTRIDTIFGMTFCVLSPEHPLVTEIKSMVTDERQAAINDYQKKAAELSDLDRQSEDREKTGVFTGAHAINPANGERVPIFVADYVLMGYGTGAIMAVPAHDDRDFEFAQKHDLDVVPVIAPDPGATVELPYPAKDGVLINSGEYDGQEVAEAQQSLAVWIEALGIGERKKNYKLRDWLISRQRYWGCPIPVVFDPDGDPETVPDGSLPVELPKVDSYEPTDDGQSPLARIDEFVNATTRDGSLGKRETDTMGGFACSSWYFLRFCDPYNSSEPWSKDLADYWMPVDCYVGGAEHAVMHLLYARFWTKVLYDAGLVSVQEPFARLQNQGQVLANTPYRDLREGETQHTGEDKVLLSFEEAAQMPEDEVTWRWARMSKSKGNVVTPDEAVEQFGADALRVYELFVAPFDQDVQWSNDGMAGAARFLTRVFSAVEKAQPSFDPNWRNEVMGDSERIRTLRRATHQAIRKATEDIDRFAFNTYVSALMIFVNSLTDWLKDEVTVEEKPALSEAIESLILLISPAAPHSSDELWESLGRSGFVLERDWPKHQEELAKEDSITLAVQVNGKLRDTIEAAADISKEAMEEAALASEKVQAHIDGKTIRRVICVPGKLVNIVAN